MTIYFDGDARLITLSEGTTSLSVVDLYSRWKDWVASGNAHYPAAFAPTGGDPIDELAGTKVPLYAFLLNGWRIKPQESNHTLNVYGGVLLVSGGGDPFVDTNGVFNVRINFSQPVQAITVSTSGASPEAIAAAVFEEAMTGHQTPGTFGWLFQRLLTFKQFIGLK